MMKLNLILNFCLMIPVSLWDDSSVSSQTHEDDDQDEDDNEDEVCFSFLSSSST